MEGDRQAQLVVSRGCGGQQMGLPDPGSNLPRCSRPLAVRTLMAGNGGRNDGGEGARLARLKHIPSSYLPMTSPGQPGVLPPVKLASWNQDTGASPHPARRG